MFELLDIEESYGGLSAVARQAILYVVGKVRGQPGPSVKRSSLSVDCRLT